MGSTRIARHIQAARDKVYRALLDADAISRWRFPEGMSICVHYLNPRVGGEFRVSLTYDAPTGTGKTTSHTDTYHGRFVELSPNQRVVEVIEFETDDPAMQGEMKITTTLMDTAGGTELTAVHDGLPSGISTVDNETGWQMALDRLAQLVEQDR